MALHSFQVHSRAQVQATAALELALRAEGCQEACAVLTKPEKLDALFTAMSQMNMQVMLTATNLFQPPRSHTSGRPRSTVASGL